MDVEGTIGDVPLLADATGGGLAVLLASRRTAGAYTPEVPLGERITKDMGLPHE